MNIFAASAGVQPLDDQLSQPQPGTRGQSSVSVGHEGLLGA